MSSVLAFLLTLLMLPNAGGNDSGPCGSGGVHAIRTNGKCNLSPKVKPVWFQSFEATDNTASTCDAEHGDPEDAGFSVLDEHTDCDAATLGVHGSDSAALVADDTANEDAAVSVLNAFDPISGKVWVRLKFLFTGNHGVSFIAPFVLPLDNVALKQFGPWFVVGGTNWIVVISEATACGTPVEIETFRIYTLTYELNLATATISSVTLWNATSSAYVQPADWAAPCVGVTGGFTIDGIAITAEDTVDTTILVDCIEIYDKPPGIRDPGACRQP